MQLRPILIGAGLAALAAGVFAQASNDRLAFDAVSIKANTDGRKVALRIQDGGRLSSSGFSADTLIAWAYSTPEHTLRPQQIVGAPEWVRTRLFSMIASVGADGPRDQPAFNDALPELVRSLLRDRFQLVAHTEVRQLPVYALVLARRDGLLGPQMHTTKADCSATRPKPADVPVELRCGAVRLAAGSSWGVGVDLAAIANLLISGTDRLVVDRTGLTGNFDVDLHWKADLSSAADASAASASVDLSTAVQEQLGLKLEPRVESTDVIVIDRIELPAED